MAKLRNTDLALTRSRQTIAHIQKDEAIGAALPDLDLTARYQHEGDNPEIEFFGERFKVVPDNSYSLNARLEQYLYSGAVSSGYKASKLLLSGAGHDAAAMENQVVAEVVTRFYRALYYRDLISVNEESVGQLKMHLKDSKDRESVGLNTGYDTKRFESQLAEAVAGLISSKNVYASSILGLLDYIGADPITAVEIDGSLQLQPMDLEFEKALSSAMENRPEIKSADDTTKAAEQLARAMKSQIYPSVKGFASYNLSNSPGLGESEDTVDSWNAGVSVELNLFDGRERSSRYRQKLVEFRMAELERERTVRRVRMEVKASHNELGRAREFVSSQVKSVEYAKETYRIATISRGEGVATQLELLDAQVALRRAKTNYSKSIYEYSIARVKLLKAIGESYDN